MLELIRLDWHIARTARSAEDELVKLAAVSQKADRKQWEIWVNEMADPHFRKRLLADQQLRKVGPSVLGYLNHLDPNQLDSEQKSRVRRIIHDLTTQSGEDTPEHIAAMLIEDPRIWLALLSRPEEATRQAAVQQLSILMKTPVSVDPKADPASQAKARDELRIQIEKSIKETSPASPPGATRPPAGINRP